MQTPSPQGNGLADGDYRAPAVATLSVATLEALRDALYGAERSEIERLTGLLDDLIDTGRWKAEPLSIRPNEQAGAP
jgi:hypothetical protein